MGNVNRVSLSGNLTREPELKATRGGTPVLNFGLAVHNKRGGEDYTNYFNCLLYGAYATTMAKYLHVGDKVAVDGQLSYDSWDHEGSRRSTVYVTVSSIDTLGHAARAQDAPEPDLPAQAPAQDVYDEDIPF